MASQPNRKLLVKLFRSSDVRKEHRALLNERTALRFVQGVCEDEDPTDVLFQLNRQDHHLVRTMFTLGSSNSFMDLVVMPFLGWLGKDALSIGTCSKRQQTICNELARAPGLLDGLLEALNCDEISDEMALLWFLERLILDDGGDGADARANGTHRALAQRLTRSLSPQVESHAQKLLKILQDPEEMSKRFAEDASTGALAGGGISLESIKESHAGGRHSNDHADFRSITIVPSVDEVLCETLPFLPTSSDPNTPHLDRLFRLLRHDMVSSVIDAVLSLKPHGTTSANGRDRSNEQARGRGRHGGVGGGGGRPPFVLRNAKRGEIVADNAGRAAAMLVHFDWPVEHPISSMKPIKQREYLQQARGPGRDGGGSQKAGRGQNLLKRDSLVVLTDKNLKPLFLANITIRDEQMMVWGQGGGDGGDGSSGGRGCGDGGDGSGGGNGGGGGWNGNEHQHWSGSYSGGRGGRGRGGRHGRGEGGRDGRGRARDHGGSGGRGFIVDTRAGAGSWRDRQTSRPAIGVSFHNNRDLEAALLLSRDDAWGCLIPLSAGVFSYEPVLKRMQSMADVPMDDLLVDWPAQELPECTTVEKKESPPAAGVLPTLPPPPLYDDGTASVIERLAERFAPSPSDLENQVPLVLSPPLPEVVLPSGCQFDISQRVAVDQVLRQRVSLVQGPPGTGKTFLGVFLAQAILSLTSESILCVCYTNHALDSFLEDLLSKGMDSLVRIGGGSKNARLDPYQLRNRQGSSFTTVQSRQYGHLKGTLETTQDAIDAAQRRLNRKPTKEEMLEWLEDEEPAAFEELRLPEELGLSGDTVVGRKGRALTSVSILQTWLDGKHKPSALSSNATNSWGSRGVNPRQPALSGIWAFSREERRATWDAWEVSLKKEVAAYVARKVENHDMKAEELSQLQLHRDLSRMQGARVVGCTTTGAAMHHALLSEAGCGVVLVEEAAEVLEAHVLTALGPSTKHLIMIGDHKQLRPKVEQYSLRAESGRGFDLNVSLFERLVNSGYPHTTLELQHRMPPEISALVRGLTYPGLRDGPGTLGRPGVRGVRDRVCFVAHNHKEDTAASLRQRQDDGGTASKVNRYEVGMVVKTVRYLLLQGYQPDQIVVLTPYLAQLMELRDALDGTISDRDASELAVAIKQGGDGGGGGQGGDGRSGKQGNRKQSGPANNGGKTGSSGRTSGPDSRPKVRVSTVDNYQGEESDLVIGSFVRSNDGGQMGFVGDANRLNVAISRARLGMILFGDIDFFTSDSVRNKSGQRLWLEFFSLLEAGGHVYRDGLPAVCETHKTRVDLSSPKAFDENVSEGGCRLVCGAVLACDGGHPCPRRCHPGDDQSHGSDDCRVTIEEVCRKGHTSKRRCTKDPAGLPCGRCEREAAAIEREVNRLAESKRQRELEHEAAWARLAEARRTAVLERDRLAHETDLLRMERETQREELDAERMRSSQRGVREKLDQNRAAASDATQGVSKATGGGGDGGGNALSATDKSGLAASSSEKQNESTQQLTSVVKGKGKGGKARDNTKTPAGDIASTKRSIPKGGIGSTLLLIATAAAEGNPGGIIDALQAVPPTKQEKISHELAVALGDAAYQWFPPSSGGEPVLTLPPAARTAQALGLMAKGEWVKARATLAAALKDTKDPKTSSKRDPSAVYALTLCDHHIGGAAETAHQLSELAAAEGVFWPGPPESHLPPDARAFPLGALVRAHLEASAPPTALSVSIAGAGASDGACDGVGADDGNEDGDGVGTNDGTGAGDRHRDGAGDEGGGGEDPLDDPKLRACLLAVSFLRAPIHNLKAGKVDSPGWKEAAEAVVRSTGTALSRALWGPNAVSTNDKEDSGGGSDAAKGAGDKVRAQWRGLQSKWGISSKAMDDLLKFSGLDVIKADFLSVAKLAVIDRERGFDLSARSFNVRLEGNPGTGKTTVARLYYRLLKDIGVFSPAEKRAQDLRDAADAAAKKKAADSEKLRVENERKAFQAAGLPYNNPPAPAGGATTVGALASNSGSSSTSTAGAGAATSKDEGFVETTGAALADCGTKGLEGMLEKIRKAGGGVLFVDEAYTLEPQGSSGGQGKQVLNFLLAEIENRRGELVVAFAGYAKNMETLFEFNEGLPSRFPKTFKFEDYSDELLLDIFLGLMEAKEGLGTLRLAPGAGEGARWAKVAIARLGRQREMRGFGNARAVRALFDKVMQRQADRLSSGDKAADEADPYELVKSDLLGVSITNLDDSADWRKLRGMIGLDSVKEAVRAQAELVKTNLVLEEAGKPPRGVALNRCMIGNPGTGKTTVAKLYAGIMADLGLLSKGEVVLKTASDFIGFVIGKSESKTRAILKASEGCVLVIDEAYSLGSGSRSRADPFRVAVVDTLVELVQNVPGEDRCVLLLGYRAEMEEFMRNTNPGLARRFAMDNAFIFEDYTDEDLLSILRGKLKSEELTAGVESLMAAAAVLRERRLTASHFGNGGEVANLLSEAKLRKEKRRGDGSIESRLDPEIVPRDFDPGYGDAPPDSAMLEDDLFGDLIGCDAIKIQLRMIRSTFVHAEKVGRDPRETLNLNFRFTGAPGTGKTTIAQRLGRMFKQLGVLRSDEVVSCSPSDFVTGYIGQAAIKTKGMMDKAIGKVLFIDEAYGLNPHQTGSHGATFMQEVVDQLVQCLTDNKYKGNMVVVVAGYARDINGLMQANSGLASRFPETLHFPSFDVEDSSRLLEAALKKGFNTDLAPDAAATLPELLSLLVQAPCFGNGRTITDLAKRIFTEIGMRIGGGGGDSSDRRARGWSDPRASVDDVRRSAAAVLAQMTDGTSNTLIAQGVNGGASPAASFGGASSEAAGDAPKTRATTTTTTATSRPEQTAHDKPSIRGRGGGGRRRRKAGPEPFLRREGQANLAKGVRDRGHSRR